MNKKSKLFSVGYEVAQDKVGKGNAFVVSCYSCDSFYQAEGDKEEMCQDPEVLQFDMTITPTSIFCNRWKVCKRKKKTIFKNGGKVIERKEEVTDAGKRSSKRFRRTSSSRER